MSKPAYKAPEFSAEDFPEDIYLTAFLDIRAAVTRGQFLSGWDHYQRYGRSEIAAGKRPSPFHGGRPGITRSVLPPKIADEPVPQSPKPLTLSASKNAKPYTPPKISAPKPRPADAEFLESLYLAQNPDSAAAVARGDLASGLAHYLAEGRHQEAAGLRPSLGDDVYYAGVAPPGLHHEPDMSCFDIETYFLLYPDVRAGTKGNPQAGREHWLNHGRFEGRSGPGVAQYKNVVVTLDGVFQKPFGINIFGPFGATSGLGSAARNLVRAMAASGIPYALHPFDVTRGQPRITPDERQRAPNFRINLFLANADQMARVILLYPPGHFNDFYNIAMWAWELANFRGDWLNAFAPLDEVWTNSAFELESIGAIAPVPVNKIRLPVVLHEASAEEGRDLFGIPRDRLVFLTIFDAGSTAARKNPRLVAEAFRDAFAADENVFLVIKFHSASLDPSVTREITRALRGTENVLVVADRLTDRDMGLLQAACDCLVSAHRSEGYGLNIAEFMAAGKPVIATSYSGNLEFCDDTTCFPLAYKLREVEKITGPYFPYAIWAEPDRQNLMAQMRLVNDNQPEAWKRGKIAAAKLRAEFSLAAIGRNIMARLRHIGLTEEKPKFIPWLGRARGLAAPSILGPLPVEARRAVAALGAQRPVISFIVPVYNVRAAFLAACIESVRAQTYPFWELCLCDDASTDPETQAVLTRYQGIDPRIRIRRLAKNLGISGASNKAVEMASGEFVAMLDNDDLITPDCLMEIVRAVLQNPEIDVIYTDEDKIDEQGRLIDTYFKPDYSPEHLESVMYILHMLVVRKKLFLELDGFRHEFAGAQDYDLMLRLTRHTQHVHHIAKSLYHWRAIAGSAAAIVDAKPWALEAGLRAITEHARALHGPKTRVEKGLLPGTFRVRRDIAGPPRISLLILTNNGKISLPGRGRFCMVDNFVDSILRRTGYKNYEIVVVDNGKLSKAQIARFQKLGVRVENYPGSVTPFNYAAKANFALRVCRTDLLVLLNDDMEVADPGWLEALVELAADPEIGGVGARLLHADGTLQHAGVVLGVNGGASHVYHSYPRDFIGYNGFTHVIRNYAAVTGACFATRKSVVTLAGGFDENFAMDFNDIDLCLRLQEAGYRIVYTPFCELFHFEGASAPRTYQNPEERRRFIARWARYMENDPYFNPNFSKTRFDFTVV
jgi:GT2 family glycosyltransferase/glycosyltransferase involved in cell wall biosynthesis